MKTTKQALTKVFAMMMSLTTLFSVAACQQPGTTQGGVQNGGEDSSTTVINISLFGGGIGRKWLDNSAERFRELVKDVEYTEGKKGVSFEIVSTTGVKVKNLSEQGCHILGASGRYSDYFAEIQKGAVMDITDVLTDDLGEWGEPGVTIESKLPAEYRDAFKGNDGKYYMIPAAETYLAASYDIDLFVKQGLYLAKAEMGTEFTSDLLPGQTYYFTGNSAYKTVGNDGIAGTDDDGLPTTLNELVAQCAYIKSKRIACFSSPGIGAHIDYSNTLIDAVWTGLAGYEQRSAVTTHVGTVEYATGVSDVELWPGTGIKAPVTETVTLKGDSTDGYKAINEAARYYAFAFMELAYQQGWFYNRYTESNYTHKEAHRAFILNGVGGMDKIASHVEGTWWYNEAEGYGLFNDYKVLSGTGKDYKNIGHWSMPTSVGNDVVTGPENARDQVVTNPFNSHMLINGNLDDVPGNEGLIQACKDFIKFLCTDAELQAFTATTGSAKAFFDYEITEDVLKELSPYQQELMRLRSNPNAKGRVVVNQYATHPTYRNKGSNFIYHIDATGYRPNFDGVQYYAVIEAYHKTKQAGKYKNAWECFQKTGFSETKWLTEIYVAN